VRSSNSRFWTLFSAACTGQTAISYVEASRRRRPCSQSLPARNRRAGELAYGSSVILPKARDPRFITIGRGGTLTDSDHRLLALWAAACAEHVLHLFESVQPSDPRPRQAIEQIRAWTRGDIRMSESRAAGGHAMGAARELSGAARHAAYAAGQAAAVAHVAAHELGAAAYAIKAARAAAPGCEERAGRLECRWQREQLPDAIRELVLGDQRLRNHICWSVFDC
jgi:Imm-5 like putative immunity protein